MRIVHLNTYDTNGGAARAIYRIHQGLRALGEDSSLIVGRKFSDDPSVVAFVGGRRPDLRMRRVLRQRTITRDSRRFLSDRPAGHECFSDDRSALGPELALRLPDADIVCLNWIAGLVDIGSFFRAAGQGRKLVWRLPDMFPFTGGCHYDAGCGRYADRCGDCPQLASRGGTDLSRQIWQRKKDALEHLPDAGLQVVAISESQAEQVRRSSILGRSPLTVIPCCVDTRTFHPQSRGEARQRLGLPADRPIVLMVVDAFDRPNKGGAHLAAAMGMLEAGDKPIVLTVGAGRPDLGSAAEHIHWGSVRDDHLLVRLYSAADLLAFPSVQESFGQTIIEALACGLPVVGFDTGGIHDAVRPGVTGFVAESMTSEALAAVLQTALEDLDRLRGLSRACREAAETWFSTDVVARRYRELYATLLAGRER